MMNRTEAVFHSYATLPRLVILPMPRISFDGKQTFDKNRNGRQAGDVMNILLGHCGLGGFWARLRSGS